MLNTLQAFQSACVNFLKFSRHVLKKASLAKILCLFSAELG